MKEVLWGDRGFHGCPTNTEVKNITEKACEGEK